MLRNLSRYYEIMVRIRRNGMRVYKHSFRHLHLGGRWNYYDYSVPASRVLPETRPEFRDCKLNKNAWQNPQRPPSDFATKENVRDYTSYRPDVKCDMDRNLSI